MSASRNIGAFSLMEILVSIAILAIMAAFIMATLNASSRKAASLRAQNHLRTMGVALFAYTAENNGRLLEGANGPAFAYGELDSSRGKAVAFWFNALDYYMGGGDQTLSGMKTGARPEWQRDPLKLYPEWKKAGAGFGVCVGYGWNHQYFGDDASNATLYGWASRLTEVSSPGRTIIIGTGEDSLNDGNILRNPLIYANSIRCRRHDGGGYYLFLDGHIQKLTPEEVMADNSYLMKKTK